jgi:hypothetical protein
VIAKDNLCLLVSRQQGPVGFRHSWVSRDTGGKLRCVDQDARAKLCISFTSLSNATRSSW